MEIHMWKIIKEIYSERCEWWLTAVKLFLGQTNKGATYKTPIYIKAINRCTLEKVNLDWSTTYEELNLEGFTVLRAKRKLFNT